MTTNIIILGSCRHEPYNLLAPNKIPNAWNTEKGYKVACKKFYPAIKNADLIIVWSPDNKIGEHTQRDINEAMKQNKRVILVTPKEVSEL